MSHSVLKIKSDQFYNSEIVLNDPFVESNRQLSNRHLNDAEIRVNTSNVSIPDRMAIYKWYTDIFSAVGKLTIDRADAEIIDYYENSKDVKLTISASVFPVFISDNEIIFDAKLFNFKRAEPTPKPNNLSWDEYFMSIAVLTSYRSKDENTKVGSVLVSYDNKILGTGYNGLPTSIDESLFPKSREGNLHETKYAYVIHSEANCLLNTTVFDISNSRMYVTLFPCNECAKLLIQKKVSEVIYLSDKYHDEPSYIASRKMFDAMGIITRKYEGDLKLIKL